MKKKLKYSINCTTITLARDAFKNFTTVKLDKNNPMFKNVDKEFLASLINNLFTDYDYVKNKKIKRMIKSELKIFCYCLWILIIVAYHAVLGYAVGFFASELLPISRDYKQLCYIVGFPIGVLWCWRHYGDTLKRTVKSIVRLSNGR